MSDVANSPPQLSADLAAFLQSGVSILVGTCSRDLEPEFSRGFGIEIAEGGSDITIFLNERTAARTLQNMAENPKVAVRFSRPIDYRTLQVKGRALSTRAPLPEEKAIVDRYFSLYTESLYGVGVPRALSARIVHWPCVVVNVALEQLLSRTPGPGAGVEIT